MWMCFVYVEGVEGFPMYSFADTQREWVNDVVFFPFLPSPYLFCFRMMY